MFNPKNMCYLRHEIDDVAFVRQGAVGGVLSYATVRLDLDTKEISKS